MTIFHYPQARKDQYPQQMAISKEKERKSKKAPDK
jgi:hypothetical protein